MYVLIKILNILRVALEYYFIKDTGGTPDLWLELEWRCLNPF